MKPTPLLKAALLHIALIAGATTQARVTDWLHNEERAEVPAVIVKASGPVRRDLIDSAAAHAFWINDRTSRFDSRPLAALPLPPSPIDDLARPGDRTEANGMTIIHRDSFSIHQGEVAGFPQPGTHSELTILVTGDTPTLIDGKLFSNGRIAIINPHGVNISSRGEVDARGGFLATTHHRCGNSSLAKAPANLDSCSHTPISNDGLIVAAEGDVFLLGNSVTTSGSISGRNVFLESRLGQTSVSGSVTTGTQRQGGMIDIAGGTVEVTSSARIDATGTRAGGRVRIGGGFKGADTDIVNARSTRVAEGAVIFADTRDCGDGGTIIVWADGATSFQGHLSAHGGREGGNGGFAEVSGKEWLGFAGSADLSAPAGIRGTLLLDPERLMIQASDPDLAGDGGGLDVSGDIAAGDYPGADSVITSGRVASLLATANLSLAASADILVSAPIAWKSGFSLTLDAGVSIRVFAAISNEGSGNMIFNSPGDIILGSNVTTGGSQTYNGRVFLVANSMVTSTGSGAIGFNSTLNGRRDLTVNTAGTTTFDGAVGNTHPLASLTLNGNGWIGTGGGIRINHPISLVGSLSASGSFFTLNAPLAAEVLNVSAVASVVNLNFASVADVNTLIGSGDELLVGTAGNDAFNVSGANSGTVGRLSFTGIGTLSAGEGSDYVNLTAGDDTFIITGSNAGTAAGINFTGIDGVAGGSGSNSLVNNSGLVFAAAANAVAGIEVFNFGNVSSPAISLSAAADIYTQTGANAAVYGGVSFSGITSVDALGGYDTINLTAGSESFDMLGASAGSVLGTAFSNIENIDALGGNDTVNLTAGDDVFTVSGAGAGSSMGLSFINIENVNAKSGTDILSLIEETAALTTTDKQLLTHGITVSDVEILDGKDTTLLGSTASDTFDLTGSRAGAVIGKEIVFAGISAINGGGGNDTFNAHAVLEEGFTFEGNSGNDVVNITMNQSAAGNFSFTAETINLNGFTLNCTGDITLSATDPLLLAAPLTAEGTVSVAGGVVLGADVVVSAGAAVTLVHALDGAYSLTVNTAGPTTFGGAIGGTTPLTSLTTDAGGTTALNGGAVTTTGSQSYDDAVTLGADATLAGTTLTLGAGLNAGLRNLTIDAGVVTVAPDASISGSSLRIQRARLYVDGTSIGDFTSLELSTGALIEVTGTETVAALFLDGVQMSAGTHGSSQSPAQFKHTSRFTGTGMVLVTRDPTPVAYADWAALHAPSGSAGDDFDGDGVPNAVEYVLGGTRDTNDLGKLPAASSPQGSFVFTYARNKASKSGDTEELIEVGENLAAWPFRFAVGDDTASSAPGITVTTNGNGTETVTLTLTRAPYSARFARLAVRTTTAGTEEN